MTDIQKIIAFFYFSQCWNTRAICLKYAKHYSYVPLMLMGYKEQKQDIEVELISSYNQDPVNAMFKREIFSKIYSFITALKWSFRRLCFHRCLSVHGGCPIAYWGTPPCGQRPPPWADTPCTVHAGVRSTSGRYASHWKAFLFKTVTTKNTLQHICFVKTFQYKPEPLGVHVQVESRRIEIYSASLKIEAQFTGVRYASRSSD